MSRIQSDEISIALRQAVVWAINAIGLVGALLVVYGITSYVTGQKYTPLEEIASVASNCATLIGVMLTASSVYVTNNPRTPIAFSKYVSAPVVIVITCVVAILYVLPNVRQYCVFYIFGVKGGGELPSHVFNGLAILGLSGGLFRSIVRENYVNLHSY